MTVEVLLSTYNGEAYLQEQLDSLVSQSCNDFFVTIRDDGSSDATISIIEEYIFRYPELFFLSTADKGNLKAAGSFMALIRASTAEYVMLCDQDDIWDPEKIEISLRKIKQLEQEDASIPILVFSDLRLMDNSGNVFCESFWEFQSLDCQVAKDWRKLLTLNVVTGCTVIINRMAISVSLPFALPEMLHDHWIAVNVSRYGKIGYIPSATISYRQHSSNVEGAHRFSIRYVLRKSQNSLRILNLLYKKSCYFNQVSFLTLCFYKVTLNFKRFF
ncbi:glycosyltransferase family 2 protein [Aliivibrio sp. S4TY2]|uniref:glycosyltransferase family 2 protein n=1 Tax=unclassified Aliivibrio TaxID=2645654 RepID=UPI002378D64D|nr:MULTISPECIES: glycosyltransferase family 2 protein [unclassified Aliivibrio]MDD9155978.1 glycosyltransferase family 2 protein [Aliivibrio sp. S4TY2]MDD9159687.1 glycosyltransferase family 2 protein [Aliivibrio sp. S4TY1]MDD9163687.1 glycosyltransferase family 2 protein [Aliivibrio sp. S4MY2]MDD9167687.1 glycosyltransferase family 2 protein [Aliivibrio sp. S4MY4]MDD9185649.1 glycosyltransferase family 2 protein [Aliivibrio sp. S4MY3]